MFQTNILAQTAAKIADTTALKTQLVADGYVAKLYKAGWAPDADSVAADFDAHEADFTGYASTTNGGAGRLWSGPAIDQAGNVGIVSPSNYFQATDAVAPNMIGGMWIEKTAGDVYRRIPFPEPVDMTAALRFLDATFFESPHDDSYVVVDF